MPDPRSREERMLEDLANLSRIVAEMGWGKRSHNAGFAVSNRLIALHAECKAEREAQIASA